MNGFECFEDSDEEQKEDGSRISSHSFQIIMEEGIRTYMNFLKADKEKPSQIIASFFKRKNKGSLDPNLLQLMNKVNQKVSSFLQFLHYKNSPFILLLKTITLLKKICRRRKSLNTFVVPGSA